MGCGVPVLKLRCAALLKRAVRGAIEAYEEACLSTSTAPAVATSVAV